MVDFDFILQHRLLQTLDMTLHVFIGFKDLRNYCRVLPVLIIRLNFFGWHLWERIVTLDDCEGVTIEFGGALILT
jgi:hypothetical protein